MAKMAEEEFLEIVASEEKPALAFIPMESYSETGYSIATWFGSLQVLVAGNRSKPAILTFHDIGMNSISCFQGFFSFADMHPILRNFCIYHVTAPGQEENAEPLLEIHDIISYPTMDELAESILEVMNSYGIKSIVGFGVGAGANILSRFALQHPDLVDGLVLVNCTARPAGWIEWIYQKWNSYFLKKNVMSSGIEDYILCQWFGQRRLHSNVDLLMTFIQFLKSMNPFNLGCFIESYIRRSDLGIVRNFDSTKSYQNKNFKCPVLLLTGSDSPHLDDTIEMNNRIDPSKVTWIKFDCGGMVLEEEPAMVAEAILYFLQGLGFVPTLRAASYTKYLSSRKLISRN